MILRWIGAALQELQAGFHRIKGFRGMKDHRAGVGDQGGQVRGHWKPGRTTGSRSALVVPMKVGNSAHGGPSGGKGSAVSAEPRLGNTEDPLRTEDVSTKQARIEEPPGPHQVGQLQGPAGETSAHPQGGWIYAPTRANLLREEPDAVILHVRVCEGRGRQRPRLLGTRPAVVPHARICAGGGPSLWSEGPSLPRSIGVNQIPRHRHCRDRRLKRNAQ